MAPSKTIPWQRTATPDAQFTYASSGSQSSPDTMEFRLSGKNGGEQIQIDWGDGTLETLNLGTSRQDFSHDYTAAGDFTIRMFKVNQKFDKFDTGRNGSLQGDTANLPKGANDYTLQFSAISGDVQNLPDGASEYNFRFTSVTGDIQNLPIGASTYNFKSTSLIGDIQNLPAGASTYNFPFTSVSGDIQNLPTGASTYNFANTSVTGDIQNLPTGASTYNFTNISVSGDIQNLPGGASTYSFQETSVSGDIQNLPGGASTYNFLQTSVSGDIQNLPTGASTYKFANTSVTGDIQNLPTGASTYTFNGTSVTGDIASYRSLTSNLSNYFINNSDVSTYSSGSYSVDVTGARIRVQELGLSSTEVDNFLIDLEASGASSGTLNIAGTNAARTSSSDAAVSALQSRGWSITVNT